MAPCAQWPSWSPDATQLLYTDYCFILSTSTDGWCVDNMQQVRWSPDGSAIVFTMWPEAPFPIYIENADGTNLHPVPNTEGGQNASFSPDGRWLIFDRAQGSLVIRSHGYAIRLDGTGRRRLTNWNGEGEPSWSPDGTRVIYACAIHPDESYRPVDPGGIPHAICEISNSHPISRTLYLDPSQAVTDPTWNADGSKILVTLRRTDRAALPLGRSTSPDHASPRQRFGSRLVTRSTSAIVDWMERPSGLITLKRNMTREMSNGR